MHDQAAILTIDSAALSANYTLLAARAAPGECAAVVKADAYGVGVENVVPVLVKAGCRTFFVGHFSEGAKVRQLAPEARIFVLNGYADENLAAYARHHLSPVLYSDENLAHWRGNGVGLPAAALFIDTGMNRLGLRLENGLALLAGESLNAANINLVMSHYASSEVPEALETAVQLAGVRKIFAAVGQGRNAGVALSFDNSSAHFMEGRIPGTLTRPGYALYGGNPVMNAPNPMRPVIRLEAPVVQVRAVKAGEIVGYNANFIAARDSVIATISCGYADGMPRNLGNKPGHPGGIALVCGVECPYAGNVSMDLITLDVTDLPEGAVKPGDFVTLIGDSLDIDRVGGLGKTIGYEILTSLGPRYRRVLKEL
jgi:alanine racemase